jgi:hypothetical protein
MQPKIILIIASGSALFSVVSLLLSMGALSKARQLAKAGHGLEGDFQNSMSDFSRDLDTLSQKAGEQARKIAWLEARARSGRKEQSVEPEMVVEGTPKPNITERRHRVLSLVRRGQDVQTIAQTLGMPYGEVELMINLLKAA